MSKKQLFEEMKFDNYQYALDVKKDAEEKLEKANSVFKLSILGSILGIFGSFIFNGVPGVIGLVIGIICYKKTGGLKKAFSWGWKLAKFGWFMVPIFPIDLMIGFAFLISVPYFFLFCPALLINILKKQAKKDIEQADEYLRYFKPANQDINV